MGTPLPSTHYQPTSHHTRIQCRENKHCASSTSRDSRYKRTAPLCNVSLRRLLRLRTRVGHVHALVLEHGHGPPRLPRLPRLPRRRPPHPHWSVGSSRRPRTRDSRWKWMMSRTMPGPRPAMAGRVREFDQAVMEGIGAGAGPARDRGCGRSRCPGCPGGSKRAWRIDSRSRCRHRCWCREPGRTRQHQPSSPGRRHRCPRRVRLGPRARLGGMMMTWKTWVWALIIPLRRGGDDWARRRRVRVRGRVQRCCCCCCYCGKRPPARRCSVYDPFLRPSLTRSDAVVYPFESRRLRWRMLLRVRRMACRSKREGSGISRYKR